MSIIVPPRMRLAIWRQNLCQALLRLAFTLAEEKKPFTAEIAHEYVQFKAHLDEIPQGTVAVETERAIRFLRARKVLVPDGDGFKLAPLADLRAALQHEGDAPAEVGGARA